MESPFFSEDYLAHYGVKGMKWGKHTAVFYDSSNRPRGRKQWYSSESSGVHKRPYAVSSTPVGNGSNANKLSNVKAPKTGTAYKSSNREQRKNNKQIQEHAGALAFEYRSKGLQTAYNAKYSTDDTAKKKVLAAKAKRYMDASGAAKRVYLAELTDSKKVSKGKNKVSNLLNKLTGKKTKSQKKSTFKIKNSGNRYTQ